MDGDVQHIEVLPARHLFSQWLLQALLIFYMLPVRLIQLKFDVANWTGVVALLANGLVVLHLAFGCERCQRNDVADLQALCDRRGYYVAIPFLLFLLRLRLLVVPMSAFWLMMSPLLVLGTLPVMDGCVFGRGEAGFARLAREAGKSYLLAGLHVSHVADAEVSEGLVASNALRLAVFVALGRNNVPGKRLQLARLPVFELFRISGPDRGLAAAAIVGLGYSLRCLQTTADVGQGLQECLVVIVAVIGRRRSHVSISILHNF